MSTLKEKLRWHVQRPLLPVWLRPTGGADTEKVEGFLIPRDLLEKGDVCYCGGVGESIVVEQHLSRAYGGEVWAFDPTPRSIAYIEKLEQNGDMQGVSFKPVGLWSSDTTLKFNAPENPEHVSHSIVEGEAPGRGHFEAPCRTIKSLMDELGHDDLALLKLNIEGAEYAVVRQMIQDGIKPRAIILAWEGPRAFRDAKALTRELDAVGYDLVAIGMWTGCYVLRDTMAAGGVKESATMADGVETSATRDTTN